MKHIKQDFSLKAWIPWEGLLGWGREQKSFISQYGHGAYQIKLTTHAAHGSKYFAHRHTLNPRVESKGQTISYFLKVVILHIKLRGY